MSSSSSPFTSLEYAAPRTLGATSQGAVLPGTDLAEVSVLVHEELTDEHIHRRDASTRALIAQIAEEARSAAQAQGYAVGWSQGHRAGAAAAAAEAATGAAEAAERAAAVEAGRIAEHQAALAELARATAEVRAALQSLAGRVEAQAAELAWELTSVIVGREVAVAEDADVVRRALAVLPGDGVATVRLHPTVVGSEAAEELRSAGATVVADPALALTDALVECDGSVADLRIADALDRVRQVLT